MKQVEALPDRSALADVAARAVAHGLAEAVRRRRRGSLALSDGSDLQGAYQRLSELELPWSQIRVLPTDQRFRPSSDDPPYASLPATPLTGRARGAQFKTLGHGDGDAQRSARTASYDILSHMPFDVVALAVGLDGHMASLFPEHPTLNDAMNPASAPVVVAERAPSGPAEARLSLSLPALLQAKLIIAVITGERKRRLIERSAAYSSLPIHQLLFQDRVPVRILWAP